MYYKLRDSMKTGDLLLWQSSTPLGWLIRKFTHADVNHAGLVIRFTAYDAERVYTLEALEHGIQLAALSTRIEQHKGHVWWYPLKDMFDSKRSEIGKVALQYVGTPYDYGGLFANAVSRISVEASRFLCSEYCHYVWATATIPLVSNIAPRPGDLKDYSIIEPGGVLK